MNWSPDGDVERGPGPVPPMPAEVVDRSPGASAVPPVQKAVSNAEQGYPRGSNGNLDGK